MTFGRVWSDEMLAELPQLVERKLQPKQILEQLYAQFGVEITRNALAGKMYRMGLRCVDARTRAVKTSRQVVIVPKSAPSKPVESPTVAQPEDESDSYAHFRWTCRYPMNDDMRAPIWCGEARRKNSPYCLQHHALCHKPVEAQ